MWKMSKRLAACVFAAAWWGIFYPELCFSEETCVRVQTETVQETDEETQTGLKKIDAADVCRASKDEIVIRSRLWEWCAENLFDARENEAQSILEKSAQSAPAGR